MTRRRIAPSTTAEELRACLEDSLKFILRPPKKTKKGAVVNMPEMTPQMRAMEVLDLLREHLLALGIESSLTKPLKDILLAFRDSERGSRPLLFQPTELHNRPPTPLWQLGLMVSASLAIDLLMKAKRKRKLEEAAKEVSAKLKRLGVPIRGSRNPDIHDWQTVRSWRQALRAAAKRPNAKNKGERRFTDEFLGWAQVYTFQKEQLLSRLETGDIDAESAAKGRLTNVAASLPPI
jgi:hypothetical protein